MVVVRGRLRLYSASGFFLLLGLVILAIGIGMATLGYWPHHPSGKTLAGGGSRTTVSGGHNSSGDGNETRMLITEGAMANYSANMQGKK